MRSCYALYPDYTVTLMQRLRTYIIRKKFPLLFLFITVITFSYCILVLLNIVGPTSEYEIKEISISENLNGIGSYRIYGEYMSKGVISANKEIEFYIYNVQYSVYNNYLINNNVYNVPDNISVQICPDKTSNLEKNPCIDVNLKKSSQDYSSVNFQIYPENIPFQRKTVIEFPYSGQMNLIIKPELSPPFIKEKVFEIQPYNTYSQLLLQTYAYIFAVFGGIVIFFQIYEFVIKNF